MELVRRASRKQLGQAALAWCAVQYLRIVKLTNRWERRAPPAAEALLAGDESFIGCFWHGRLATMRAAWPHDPGRFHMLISGHSDGAIIARAMRRLGFPVISGSSRRGAVPALRSIKQVLARGACVGVTPDGPRGPRMHAKLGAIKAAAATGAPILPVSGAVKRCSVLKTWDRFMAADFFSRGMILYGEPISVPPNADRATLEHYRLELETRLNALTAEADRLCDLEPIEPAPLDKHAVEPSNGLSDNGGPDNGAVGDGFSDNGQSDRETSAALESAEDEIADEVGRARP